ncbi:MAG: RDD family protein [Glaciecola sp.]
MNEFTQQRAGFFKRLAAMVYDALIAVAVGMLAALIFIIALTVLLETGLLSKQGFAHVNDLIQASVVYKTIIQVWVAFWVIGFYLWFWKNGGQTLGMRAWRLRLYQLDPNAKQQMTYPRLLLRLISALGGFGTLLVLIDFKTKLALQDRVAGTQMLSLSKEQNHHKNW